ncbi:MAG: NAD-glutamate dehydrogenase domain-containing protein [Croceibacterium sp.]
MAAAKRHDQSPPTKSTAAGRKLVAALRRWISASQLPGDTALSASQLDDAAAFLAEAAHERAAGAGAVLVRSDPAARVTRIAVVNKDMPFLVDSVSAAVAAQGLSIDLLVHPIVAVTRSAAGVLTDLPSDSDDLEHESMIYLETPRTDAKVRRAIERELATTLVDVRAAVADWHVMQQLMVAEDAARLATPDGADLLRWLGNGMLTQLGHLTRRRDGSETRQLGICRKSARDLLAEDTYTRAFAWYDRLRGEAVKTPLIIKANRLSRVHRRVPLDLIFVPVIEGGKVTALSIHAGIWTSAASGTPPEEVPVLRRQLAAIGEEMGFLPGSHDGKALIHALTALPHDLVIGFQQVDITRVAGAMMSLADRPRPRLAIVVAPLKRHAFAFVWLPRDLLSTATRMGIQTMLEQGTAAETLDWTLQVDGGNLAVLRFVLDLRGRDEPDEAALDRHLQDMLRGWADAVEAALGASEDPGRAAALAARYAEAFPASYRAAYSPAEAAQDIERIRALAASEDSRPLHRDVRLWRQPGDAADQLRLKIYQLAGTMPLSDAVPALENFGFRVLGENPTELTGIEQATLYDFRVALADGSEAAGLLVRASETEQAICAVLNGQAEDDVFNRLVTGAGLTAREADWLRAIYRYLRQANIAFTIYTVVEALGRAPVVTRALIDLLVARHDPAFRGDRDKAAAAADDHVRAGLATVAAINDDRLLRLYWAIVGAILRTNAFVPAGAEALAFKFDSALVPGLPRPVPWREIFVYSQRVEGIHLRAGPVARGGIRWSDRRDDFRTEILGLMKAQRVKNAVIVPTGAKGGFYPKRLPDPTKDRAGWAAEGLESYKLFIRSLLSLTDNIVGARVVHPAGIVIRDCEDPYFVVAADKGTASFSDTANALAEERGFWLGDAFASGGSIGYDHKAMGITAKGAWLSVQRHFLELAVDVQNAPVRVVGCGDMSGDVFGNGMLLSKSIKLVAAYDHRHIFIDPDPDAAASWAERRRLFVKPASSWADYAEKLLSRGGGIYPRSQKRIVLSPQAQAALDVATAEFDPESLINAILKSPVDLIWFGGIGTYIKASSETHQQVGDPANDGLRVSGDEVRAKVIGEGANLGVTQAGRIEFALRGDAGLGGRINTDFIDNSAGVDCSDNEVNIKIALGDAKASGKLTEARRVTVLREMTGDVAALVLEDNRLQALALSIAETGGARSVASLARLMETLEEAGELDRRTEGLADSDTLRRRAADGHGLTRPELAVLLSTTKLALQEAIEASPVALDESTVPLLLSDFPPLMRAKFKPQLLRHRLRPRIVGTVVANLIVNRMGLIHPFELAEEEGAPFDHVAAAFVGACRLLGMDEIWTAIDAAQMPEAARLLLFDQAALALRGHLADWLRTAPASLAPSVVMADLAPGVRDLVRHVDALLGNETRDHAQAIAARLIAAGAPDALAASVAKLFAIDGAIGLARVARDTGIAPVRLTHAFIDLGELLGLGWAQSAAALMSPSDPWERLLVAGLARDFQQMRFEFIRTHARRNKADLAASIERWGEKNAGPIRQFRAMVARAQAPAGLVAPAMLAHIASQARNLLRR